LLHPKGEYTSLVEKPWLEKDLAEKIDLVKSLNSQMKTDDRIVDWTTMIMFSKHHSFYVTNGGGEIYQSFDYLVPYMSLIAAEGSQVQKRSLDSFAVAFQGGAEALTKFGFNSDTAKRLGGEALELLKADNCPSGKMDLVLDPGQMTLQIHESIGHPLEIDRILGDERNYAGTSFVTPDMFGKFQYGSELLNIAFDPSRNEQFATYAFDDDGVECKKEFLIEKGILKRGLGSNISQARSGLPGVANSKAQSWNRAPIDRMANINLEAGSSTFDEMISSVEKGVYMMTNTSWSIDDSRNKFQFGCEWGRMIENGKLTKLVRNPNYRGISRNFWRNLKMVGDESTFRVLGTPNCGKGEPNQVALVGHATPTCLFSFVDVFGGE
jgi:predicted Zn-dependent protease